MTVMEKLTLPYSDLTHQTRTDNYFYVLGSSNQTLSTFEWGIGVDYPLANWQVH